MYSKVNSSVLYGIDGHVIEIETHICNGMPNYIIVGLPNQVIRESKDRVKAAIKSCGFKFPDTRVTQNMFPAHLKKEGAQLDLPIAMGILSCTESFKVDISKYGVIGEVSLEGEIRPVTGVLSLVEGFKSKGIYRIIMPKSNMDEISTVENVRLYPYDHISKLVKALYLGELEEAPIPDNVIPVERHFEIDYDQIIGQKHALRAIKIAVVGTHNLLLVGPQGSGKSMIAERLPTVLTKPQHDEINEIKKIKSFMGPAFLNDNSCERPFCMPHHTVTRTGMIGGTSALVPGVVTKAHKGALYLDELTEFKLEVLEALREPLTTGKIHLTRNHQSVVYPADFMLVATMNPCPCGHHLSSELDCTCSAYEIKRFLNRLSGPFLDRLDMAVFLDRVKIDQKNEQHATWSSAAIKEHIRRAMNFKERLNKGGERVEFLPETDQLLYKYYKKGKISMRKHVALMNICRSIALLEESKYVEVKHLHEAISYQDIDRLKV